MATPYTFKHYNRGQFEAEADGGLDADGDVD